MFASLVANLTLFNPIRESSKPPNKPKILNYLKAISISCECLAKSYQRKIFDRFHNIITVSYY